MLHRRERVAELIRAEIGTILLKEFDMDFGWTTITRVKLTKDLRNAKVYITSIKEEERVLSELNSVSALIRQHLAKNLNLRHTPTISFVREEWLAK
jgi:ribosome-binding factor A